MALDATVAGLGTEHAERMRQGVREVHEVAREYEWCEQQYRRGLITSEEQYNRIVELWTKATDDVTDAVKGLLDFVSLENQRSGCLPLHSTEFDSGNQNIDPFQSYIFRNNITSAPTHSSRS